MPPNGGCVKLCGQSAFWISLTMTFIIPVFKRQNSYDEVDRSRNDYYWKDCLSKEYNSFNLVNHKEKNKLDNKIISIARFYRLLSFVIDCPLLKYCTSDEYEYLQCWTTSGKLLMS